MEEKELSWIRLLGVSGRSDEAVADAADGKNVARARGVILDIGAQADDEIVDREGARPSPDAVSDQRAHSGTVARPEADLGRRDHLVPAGAPPINQMAGLDAQFPKELPLGAAVALAKGMDGVDFAQIVACPNGETRPANLPQIVFNG